MWGTTTALSQSSSPGLVSGSSSNTSRPTLQGVNAHQLTSCPYLKMFKMPGCAMWQPKEEWHDCGHASACSNSTYK